MAKDANLSDATTPTIEGEVVGRLEAKDFTVVAEEDNNSLAYWIHIGYRMWVDKGYVTQHIRLPYGAVKDLQKLLELVDTVLRW